MRFKHHIPEEKLEFLCKYDSYIKFPGSETGFNHIYLVLGKLIVVNFHCGEILAPNFSTGGRAK